jgi:hypothetical protein
VRRAFKISADDLAKEIGTTPNAILHIECRKSVTTETAGRFVIGAVRLARRDISKHEALAAHLREKAQGLLRDADALKR